MRERTTRKDPHAGERDNKTLADVKSYFTSFYKSTVKGEPQDRHTIPGVTELESRFHYNATENSILRALVHYEPLPPGAEMWHLLQERKEWNVLDIGSGTGHWVDFYKDVFFAAKVTAIEIVDEMADFLKKKYKGDASVTVILDDISQEGFSLPEKFDIVNAIGVMFHIVDDAGWERAMANLAAMTKPGGLLVMGGDFGDETRDVQFHKQDDFDSWQEHDAMEGEDNIVNKRIRSLTMWEDCAKKLGLEVIELVRSDAEDVISTPENDVLLLKKPE